VLSPFASKYCVSFEPYFLVSVSVNILEWHSFPLLFMVQVWVAVFPPTVTILLLFCPSIWWSQGALQVP